MTQHRHHPSGGRDHHLGDHDAAGLADLLDLDAEVHDTYLDEVTAWTAGQVREDPRTIVDVGAGTGTGALALARRFRTSEVVAIDRSASMLERVLAAATRHGVPDRVRVIRADLDAGWPDVGELDLAWAASSLHELTDPDRLLRDLYAALVPGGLLVVTEMDSLPHFLPDEVGHGRPGLERRCHEALARAGWNEHPDWHTHLERAGFEIAEQRSFTLDASPAPASTGRYAQTYLSRIRSFLDAQLSADDLSTLDHLLADGHPQALLRRDDLIARGSRTAWAAHRPTPR